MSTTTPPDVLSKEKFRTEYPAQNSQESYEQSEEEFISPNPLSDCLALGIRHLGRLCYYTFTHVMVNSPTILLSSGLALAVHYFGSQLKPTMSASIEGGLAGAVSVGKFVGLVFLVKEALAIFIEDTLGATMASRAVKHGLMKANIQDHAVRHLTPMALGIIIAYKQGIPVDVARGTLYTIGIFALIKLLDKGYDAALQWYSPQKQQRG